MFDLRAWLRRSPKPRKLRLSTDDNEKIVDLGKGRCKWAEVEQTVLNERCSLVECLDEDGSVTRSYRLEDPGEDTQEAKADNAIAKREASNAAMLDAYGKRLVEAFHAGSAAASVSQDHLVGLVEGLVGHLSIAITNLHTISSNYATLLQQHAAAGDGEEGGKSDAMLGLLTAMIGKGLPSPPPPPTPNGKKTP